jgi:WD40 repeat protein
VWEAEVTQNLLPLPRHRHGVFTLCLSPDASRLVTGSSLHNTLLVWDTRSGRHLFPLVAEDVAASDTFHLGAVDLAYSPDGTSIASTWQDRKVRVWDSRSGRLVHCLSGHESIFIGVDYSPDGSRLVSNADGTAGRSTRVWDVRTGELLDDSAVPAHHLPADTPPGQHFPLRARSLTLGTVIEERDTATPIAWVGSNLDPIQQVSERSWAGIEDCSVLLFALEGTPCPLK